MAASALIDLFVEELRDTYSSETQILANIGAMAEAATSPALRDAFKAHEQETRLHVDRLEQVFKKLGESPDGNTCEATQGLIAELHEVLGHGFSEEILDVALIMGAQKIEHYEIASYGSLRAIADVCDLDAIANLLDQTLADEKDQDELLTELADREVNPAAVEASLDP